MTNFAQRFVTAENEGKVFPERYDQELKEKQTLTSRIDALQKRLDQSENSGVESIVQNDSVFSIPMDTGNDLLSIYAQQIPS